MHLLANEIPEAIKFLSFNMKIKFIDLTHHGYFKVAEPCNLVLHFNRVLHFTGKC